MSDTATNPQLGNEVHKHLLSLGLETPMARKDMDAGDLNPHSTICDCHTGIMEAMGLDLKDDSLKDTPTRVAKMYCDEIFTGLSYSNFPKCTTVENKWKTAEMVAVNGITVQSMCEHHFLPFVGTANVAYIPKTKVLGLSKFNRVVDFFSRRPQVQERLNEQIHAALCLILDTDDVAVSIAADHLCVRLRGVRDVSSHTVTSRVSGRFRTVPELRLEWLTLTQNGK